MKTRQNNDVTDRTGTDYDEKENELLWSNKSIVVCDENKIEEWLDQSYKSGLRWKQNWIIVTN